MMIKHSDLTKVVDKSEKEFTPDQAFSYHISYTFLMHPYASKKNNDLAGRALTIHDFHM
jgi:hypothetical protein